MISKFSIALFLYSKNRSYSKLLALANQLSAGLASSAYTNLIPDLPTFDGQITTLSGAMAAWGDRGNHGSSGDKANLLQAANVVRISCTQLAQCVMDQDPNNPTAWQNAGFTVKAGGTPVSPLQAVQDLHQVVAPNVPQTFVRLRWKRPLASERVKGIKYKVMRSTTSDFSTAVLVAIVSKSFCQYQPATLDGAFYFIIPLNSDGSDAVVSDPCFAKPRQNS